MDRTIQIAKKKGRLAAESWKGGLPLRDGEGPMGRVHWWGNVKTQMVNSVTPVKDSSAGKNYQVKRRGLVTLEKEK